MAAMLHAALFVDDDAALLDTFRRTFHGEPFRILAACDTAAAPAALGREIVIVTKPCDARGLPHAIRLALQQRDAIREARRLLRHAMPDPALLRDPRGARGDPRHRRRKQPSPGSSHSSARLAPCDLWNDCPRPLLDRRAATTPNGCSW
jgi:hypothetical protein